MAERDVARASEELARVIQTLFTPPEFIPGCEVKSIADIDEYSASNGWIEAVCGRHNQQRVRYKGFPSNVLVGGNIDIVYFKSHQLFEAYGSGGTGSVPALGAGTGDVAASVLVDKGSIFAASASGVACGLGAGSDGQYLIADSSQDLGLKWTAGNIAPRTAFIDGSLSATCNVGPVHIIHADCEVEAVYAHVKENGSSGSTIVDITNSTSSIFSASTERPSIAHDDSDSIGKSGSLTTNLIRLSELDTLQTNIDSVASGASGLTVLISLRPLTTASVAPASPAAASGVDVIEAQFHGEWLDTYWTYGGPLNASTASTLDVLKFFDT